MLIGLLLLGIGAFGLGFLAAWNYLSTVDTRLAVDEDTQDIGDYGPIPPTPARIRRVTGGE